MLAQDGADRTRRDAAVRVLPTGQRQLEAELVQPVAHARRRQPQPAEQGSQRRLQAPRAGRPRHRATEEISTGRRARTSRTVDVSSTSRSAAAKSASSKTECTKVPKARRARGSRPAAAATPPERTAPPRARRRATSSSGSLRHPRLVGGRGDVAVGRPPPAAIELAVKARGLQVQRRRQRLRARRSAARSCPTTRRSRSPAPTRRVAEARDRIVVRRRPAPRSTRTLPDASRSSSSRDERRVRLFHVPAHQTTAWCLARVRAT